MTREEAINKLRDMITEIRAICDESKHMSEDDRQDMETFDMAIKALEQEPCDDCISRQAVLNTLFYKSDNNCEVVLNKELQDRIKALPHVTPTHKEWIPVSERLPEESIKQIMLGDEHTSDFVLVTIKGQTYPFPKAKVKVARYSYTHKAWQIANNNFGKVVAWMPLPEPYKAESEG